MIANGDFHPFAGRSDNYRDLRRLARNLGRAVFQGVVDQIGQGLADQLALAADRRGKGASTRSATPASSAAGS